MNFQDDVLRAKDNKKILLDFYTPSCGPCRKLSPILSQIEQEWDSAKNGELVVEKVDASSDEGSILGAELGVSAVPTLMLYQNGVQIAQWIGSMKKEDLVDRLITAK